MMRSETRQRALNLLSTYHGLLPVTAAFWWGERKIGFEELKEIEIDRSQAEASREKSECRSRLGKTAPEAEADADIQCMGNSSLRKQGLSPVELQRNVLRKNTCISRYGLLIVKVIYIQKHDIFSF